MSSGAVTLAKHNGIIGKNKQKWYNKQKYNKIKKLEYEI